MLPRQSASQVASSRLRASGVVLQREDAGTQNRKRLHDVIRTLVPQLHTTPEVRRFVEPSQASAAGLGFRVYDLGFRV